MVQHRPHTTVMLAMSADGKIADVRRSPARFGSKTDIAHPEEQIVCFRCCFIRYWNSTRLRYNPNCIAPTTAATTNSCEKAFPTCLYTYYRFCEPQSGNTILSAANQTLVTNDNSRSAFLERTSRI